MLEEIVYVCSAFSKKFITQPLNRLMSQLGLWSQQIKVPGKGLGRNSRPNVLIWPAVLA